MIQYSILKQVIDSAGNVGFVLEQQFTGDDASALSLLQSLIQQDSIPRYAEIIGDAYTRTIQP